MGSERTLAMTKALPRLKLYAKHNESSGRLASINIAAKPSYRAATRRQPRLVIRL